MSKLAERLQKARFMSEACQLEVCDEAATALDACERALRDFIVFKFDRELHPAWASRIDAAKEALAKLEAAQ